MWAQPGLQDKPPSNLRAAMGAWRVPGGWVSLSRRAHLEGREDDNMSRNASPRCVGQRREVRKVAKLSPHGPSRVQRRREHRPVGQCSATVGGLWTQHLSGAVLVTMSPCAARDAWRSGKALQKAARRA